MVTAGSDVESVALGPEGLVQGASPGMIHVDIARSRPRLRETSPGAWACAESPCWMRRFPGGVAAAKTASLTIFVGGDRPSSKARGRCWQAWASRFLHGPVGNGAGDQAANQIAQLACLQGAAEALLFAREQGANPARCARRS